MGDGLAHYLMVIEVQQPIKKTIVAPFELTMGQGITQSDLDVNADRYARSLIAAEKRQYGPAGPIVLKYRLYREIPAGAV